MNSTSSSIPWPCFLHTTLLLVSHFQSNSYFTKIFVQRLLSTNSRNDFYHEWFYHGLDPTLFCIVYLVDAAEWCERTMDFYVQDLCFNHTHAFGRTLNRRHKTFHVLPFVYFMISWSLLTISSTWTWTSLFGLAWTLKSKHNNLLHVSLDLTLWTIYMSV